MDVAGARSAPIPIPASNRVHAVSAPGTDIVLELTSIEQKRQVLQTNRVVVIDIYGDWCGPCKQVAPKYAQLAAKYNRLGHCLLVKENVKNDPPLSQNIRGVPCFHFFLDGNLVDTITGGNITAVEQKVQELCSA
jgi:thioredoxin 1